MTTRYIPGFELIGVLGRGGMGEVFRAKNLASGEIVALKVMRSHLADERAVGRFHREAAVMKAVRHPNLIRLYESGAHEGDLWISMELVEGASIDRILAAKGPMDPRLVGRLMAGVCQALGAMHSRDMLHRDIKPGNIIVETSGRPVLMDLGLAKNPDHTKLTKTGHLLGTPVYLPFEVYKGEPFDASVDFYSVGVTWWECLTGNRPFEFDAIVQAVGKNQPLILPPPQSPHGPVSAPHLRLIHAMASPRDERPRDLAEVEAILAGKVRPATGEEELEDATLESTASSARIVPVEPLPNPDSEVPDVEPSSTDYSAVERRGIPRGLVSVFLLGLIVGAGFQVYRMMKDPVISGDGEPVVSGLKLVDRWRDGHSVIFEGVAADTGSVRAYRIRPEGNAPVAVFAVDRRKFYVLVTGLPFGERGTIEVRTGSEPPVTEEFQAQGRGVESEGRRFPLLFRRLAAKPGDRVLQRQLAGLRQIVDIGRNVGSDMNLFTEVGSFQTIPENLWSTLLSWLEEPDGFAPYNLARCLKFSDPRVPPVVVWHLLHRLADSRWSLSKGDVTSDLGFDLFKHTSVPAAVFPLLDEWSVSGGPKRGLFRVLFRVATNLSERPKVPRFPLQVPGWDERQGLDRKPQDPLEWLPKRGSAGLVRLALQARRGDPAALAKIVGRAQDEASSERNLATCVLAITKDRSQIGPLLEEYRTAQGERFEALERALWGFRTVGGMWTASNQQILQHTTFTDFEVDHAEVPEGSKVVARWETGALYADVPGTGAEVTLVAADGRRVRFLFSAKSQPKRME